MRKKQTSRMEDYLEAIYELHMEEGVARISRIANMLDVTMPTVNSAVKSMKERGLVTHHSYGDVKLTDEGAKIAKETLHRHEVLTDFLHRILGLDEETSGTDACKIEHALSQETAKRMAEFVEFVVDAPQRPEWLKNFAYYYKHGKRPSRCEEMVASKTE